MARIKQPKTCRVCGRSEEEVYISARHLCPDCAAQRIEQAAQMMRALRAGMVPSQVLDALIKPKTKPAPEILRQAAAIVEAVDAAAAQEEKLTHYAAVALAELGEDIIQELQATEEPITFVRKNGCIWLKSGDKEHYLHL